VEASYVLFVISRGDSTPWGVVTMRNRRLLLGFFFFPIFFWTGIKGNETAGYIITGLQVACRKAEDIKL